MKYSKTNIDDLESRDIDDLEPTLRAVGYDLQPTKMRPSVWEFDTGDENERHRQREQEELYVVLDGRLEMEIEDEVTTVTAGDCIVVPPESWRQLTAEERSRVLVVGAPNVSNDAIDEDD